MLLLLPIVASLMAMDFETRCHSQQFTRAKRSLDRMILTQVQRDAIKTHEAAFYRAWNNTHRRKGCSHHEAHAVEFIAAASGVLTDAQFKSFRKRARNEVEHVQHEVWQTGVYIDNLIKIAAKL
ncbi:MAG: hypothetical protein CMJ83_21515 [Planctomycetes bacterium]|nr:hypothetical protein [Planctomycetota bacterium]